MRRPAFADRRRSWTTCVLRSLTLGLDPAGIATEVFGAHACHHPGHRGGPVVAPHQPDGDPGSGPDVTFARSGLTVPWRTDVASVLELAEACDVPTRWSCRTGICHTCETGLLAGAVRYDPPPIDQPADGNILICCAAPTARPRHRPLTAAADRRRPPRAITGW